MVNIIRDKTPGFQEKVWLMAESARFDMSEEDMFFESYAGGKSCGRLPAPNKVPKAFMSSDCVFDCQYCGCRRSNDQKRGFTFTPEELADISVKGARLNNHGIFLTSAVYKSPDYTQELINRTIHEIRKVHGYRGYLHAKIMPGADLRLIYEAGLMADRLSVNIELPHSSGYQTIARQKNKENILGPMGAISSMIKELGGRRSFATSQITQMMVGTMGEDDRTIIALSQAMYKKYRLSRVYYSAFSPVQETAVLPSEKIPFWRQNRIYQADRLLAMYKMNVDELVPAGAPFLERDIDPKTAWALRNLDLFPMEVTKAGYESLIRVPGIGPAGAQKIVQTRKYAQITPEALRKMRISLKYSLYFLTFGGRYYGGILDAELLRARLAKAPVKVQQMQLPGQETGLFS